MSASISIIPPDPATAFLFALARNPAQSTTQDNELGSEEEEEEEEIGRWIKSREVAAAAAAAAFADVVADSLLFLVSMRARIMSIKVGSEGRAEQKETKQKRKRSDRPTDPATLAKQNERAERRRPSRKRKTVKRCTSPSHFAMEPEEEIKYGAEYTLDLPARARMDSVLRQVSAFYYKPKEVHTNSLAVYIDPEYDQLQYTTIDLLLSPIRKRNPRDSWSYKEIAIFESAMCAYPKDFHKISQLIQTKTTPEVVKFYYTFWKHQAHYRIWKNGGDLPPVGLMTPTAAPTPKSKRNVNPSSAAAPSSASASASHSPTPTAMHIGALEPNSTPRVRMIDTRNGRTSWFILPHRSDLDQQKEVDEVAEAEEDEEKKEDEQKMQDDETPTIVTPGYRCCLPSDETPNGKCRKFFRSTNALAMHLRFAHHLNQDAALSSREDHYIESVH